MGTKANISVSLVLFVLLIGSLGTATAGTIYVDANAAPGGDGSTWGTAYKYLQDAFYKPPTSGDEIWVAAETYKPDQDEGGNVTLGDRSATFELKDGVSSYGGFPIGGGTWEQRDPNVYETILTGDLDYNDEPNFVNYSENCHHVVTSIGTDSNTVLDGFTITGGNADTGNPVTDRGGGMYNAMASPRINSCTFAGNLAKKRGGGMYNGGLSTTPELVNCTFVRNQARESAGAMYNWEGGPNLRACKFLENSAELFDAGAVLNENSVCEFRDCVFRGNTATFGGAVKGYAHFMNCEFVENIAVVEGGAAYMAFIGAGFVDCNFVGNSAEWGDGGAIWNYECNTSLLNCTFIGNSAVRAAMPFSGGGAVFNTENSRPTLRNCMFMANFTDHAGGGIYNELGSRPTLVNCTFVGNVAGDAGGGVFALDSTVTLTNCTLTKNSATRGDALACDSPLPSRPSNVYISNCIFWDGPDEISNDDGSTITISYSDVQGGWSGPGGSNIDVNPDFICDPNDGGDGWGVGGNDDFGNLRLQYMSPCIDTADNSSVPADSEDLDEHPRILDGDCNTTEVVDMGAYEFSYTYLGDFAGGCDVDFADFAVFAMAWLTEEGQAGYDPNCDIALPYDGAIDEKDLQVFRHSNKT